MHLKVNGGMRSVFALSLVLGASACGSTNPGGLFNPNPVDAGIDADVPDEGGVETHAPDAAITDTSSSAATSSDSVPTDSASTDDTSTDSASSDSVSSETASTNTTASGSSTDIGSTPAPTYDTSVPPTDTSETVVTDSTSQDLTWPTLDTTGPTSAPTSDVLTTDTAVTVTDSASLTTEDSTFVGATSSDTGVTPTSGLPSDATTSDVPTSDTTTSDTTTSDAPTTDTPSTGTGTGGTDGSSTTNDTSSPVGPTSEPNSTASDSASTSIDSSSGPVGPVLPTCVISVPSKSLLNGVASPTGDRVNSPSAPFKTSITVTTDVPNGSNVILSTGSGSSLLTQASDGSAVFPAVELDPDGDYTLRATCQGALSAQSDPVVVSVDTHGPTIGSGLSPLSGHHYSPGDDEDTGTPGVLDFSVCVPVASDDAVDLGTQNVCVWTGAAGPFCAAAQSDAIAPGTDGACIPVQCPGSAPFNIDVRVSDEAGNPTTASINGVTCASQTPTVQIISLTDNRTAPTDVGLRLLAAGNTNPASILKDSDSHTSGAQHAVVACTNATIGSSASLKVGLQSGSITQRTTGTVQTDTNNLCPTGLGGIVNFATITLDNSTVASGALQAYTVVRVQVTDASTEVGTSPDVYVWVDPTLPVVQVLLPTRLCEDGILASTGSDVVASMNMRSGGVYPVSARLLRKSDATVLGTYTFSGSNDFVDVTFPLGTNTFQATALEASGNLGILGACDVRVADLPEITWDNPLVSTTALVSAGVIQPNAIEDEDANTPGWQGTLQVVVSPPQVESLDGMQVQFLINDVEYGNPIDLNDSHGSNVTVSLPVDILDGNVDISAVIFGAADDVVSTLTDILVDTAPPEAASGLQVAVQSRRETAMQLSWTPPASGVEGYHVAYLAVDAGDVTSVIDESNFETVTQAPDVDGAATSTVIHDLMIEQRYLFAIRPFDTSGNIGPVLATSSPVRSQFSTFVLAPPAGAVPGTQWGYSVDASTDLNGDGLADMVVGQKFGDRVVIYLGQSNGTYASQPDVIIDGPPDAQFGASVAVVGNVIGDSREDIVVAAPSDATDGTFGRVYVIAGRAWSSDYLDLSDGTNPTGAIIAFPSSLAVSGQVTRLGDFDGDGDFDFGIHAYAYDAGGFCDPDTTTNCAGAFILIKGLADASLFPAVVTIPDDTGMFEAYLPSSLPFYGADWLLGITDLIGSRSGVLAAEYQAGAQRILMRNSGTPAGFDAQELIYGGPQYSGNTLTFDTEIGSYPAALVGDDTVAIALTGARDGLRASPGIVDLYTLASSGTFATPYKTLQAGGGTNNFGQILIGNRYSGRPSSYSLPFFGRNGEARSMVLGGGTYQGKVSKLFMLGASTLATLSATPVTQELTDHSDVEYLLSDVPGINPDWIDALNSPSANADWHGGIGFPIRDMNGDGFADIGITEWEAGGGTPVDYTGGMVILY